MASNSSPKKRVLSPEHLAKMKEGRERARRERQQAEQQDAAANSEEVPDSGLTRTNSAEIRQIQETRTLDDVARRHVAEPDDDDDDDDEEYASPEEVAEQTDIYTSGDEIAPDEPDPMMRKVPTMGRVLREEGDGELLNFQDLMAEYGRSIQLGLSHIDVTRKSPVQHEGLRIKGVQRPITQQMTLQDFSEFYGAGEYELIVYGPSQRGGHRFDPVTGAVINRRLTKPISLTIPYGVYEPSLDALAPDDEDYMRHPGTHPGFPLQRIRSTPADAKIHETDVAAEERREERQRQDKREREAEEKRRQREEEGRQNALVNQLGEAHREQMQLLRESHENQLQILTRQLQEVQEELKESRKEPKRNDGELLAQLLPAMKGDPEMRQQLERAFSEDRARQAEAHRQEIQRLNEASRQELDRARTALDEERRRHDDRMQQLQRDVDVRISEAREAAEKRVRDVEGRQQELLDNERREAERRMQNAENTNTARLADLDRFHQSEVRQLKGSHEAELRQIRESYETRTQTMQAQHASELGLKENEITRLRDALAKAEEKANKPLHEQMTEFSDAAEAMGYSKGDSDEPKDWKSMMAEGGMAALQRLPEIMQNVSVMLNSRRQDASQPGAPPRQLPPAQGAPTMNPVQQQQLPFATEDGIGVELEGLHSPRAPIYPKTHGEPHPPPQPPPQQMVQQVPQPQPAPPQPAPPQPAPPQPAHQAVQPNPAPPQIDPETILQQAEQFEAAFEQSGDAEEFVLYALNQFGPQMVSHLINVISVEQIVAVLQEQRPESPLLRRDGQKFMKDVWLIAHEQIESGGS